MRTINGFGEVRDGKLKIRKEEEFWREVSRLKGNVWIRVQRTHSKRSLLQNAYYWGVVVQILSDELGYDPDDIHKLLKQKFNPITLQVGDESLLVGDSTTNLSTVDMMAYIERIQRWAASFLQINIPSPNENL